MARLNQESRSHESPMDFVYTNNDHGPVPTDSVFIRAASTQEKSNTWAGPKRQYSTGDQLDKAKKQLTNSTLNSDAKDVPVSPTKSILPRFPASGNQKNLNSSTPASKAPFRNPSFTTPQRDIDMDFSSGIDQSSPANADSEDTPDPPPRSVLSGLNSSVVPFVGNKFEDKPQSSLLDKHIRSGRGGIRKLQKAGLLHRGEKRRRRDSDKDISLAPRRLSDDSDYEERPSSSEGSQQKLPSVQRLAFVPSVLTFIDAHPNLPSTLSYYVQFFLNCFFAFCLMYVLYGVYSTISNDIDEKVMMESSEIFAEMAACAHEFQANRCERHTRVPAMETVCNNWEKCMQRDPYKVGRSRLSAGMFAEIFNSFIEPISLKAIIVSVSVIVGCFAVNNLTFGLLRAKHDNHQPPPHTPYMRQPHQQQMGWPPVNEHYYTPYQNHIGAQGMGQVGFQLEGQSPSKRLGYR
ncbi:hypothetical protein P7C71_g358, partial [Lecanoromycetidae sp. Uapishka_2]